MLAKPKLRRVRNFLTLAILALFVSACASTPEPKPVAPAAPPEPKPAPPAPPPAPKVEILPAAPEKYVVKKGDTLWDISSHFLRDPWYWPEIWHVNGQIANPHLIYPGDVITLYYVGGQPFVSVNGGPRVTQGERLLPQIRESEANRGDDIVPVQTIQQFIIHPRVVPAELLKRAAYVVASQDLRMIYGEGDRVYVRNLKADDLKSRYSVFKPGKALRDPKTNELLGYEAVHLGEADLLKHGDPSTVYLRSVTREVRPGARLLPVDNDDRHNTFLPHAPNKEMDGEIISLFEAISEVGQNQVVVINRGTREGMERGHVLAVNQAGRKIKDNNVGRISRSVTLPEERAGVIMIFRTFDKVSYGLIMKATRAIHLGDTVGNP